MKHFHVRLDYGDGLVFENTVAAANAAEAYGKAEDASMYSGANMVSVMVQEAPLRRFRVRLTVGLGSSYPVVVQATDTHDALVKALGMAASNGTVSSGAMVEEDDV